MTQEMQKELELAKEALGRFNTALEEKDMTARNDAEKDIREHLKTFKVKAMNENLEELRKCENPILEAVKRMTYTIKKLKIDKEDGVEIGASIKDAEERISLVKVCTYAHLKTDWQYKVEKFGYLVTLKNAKDINLALKRLQAVKNDYRLTEIARKLEWGETPTSNTQVGKLLQELIDALLPGSGKIRKEDIEFCLQAATRYAPRESKTIQAVDTKTYHNILMDVMNAIITKEGYAMKFKKMKDAQPEGETPEDTKAEEKAETIVVEDPKAPVKTAARGKKGGKKAA